MSDVAIVLAVGLACAAAVAVVWLRLRAAALVRAEAREEREKGVVAIVDAMRGELKSVRDEQRTFMANARPR